MFHYGQVAQSVEQRIENPCVGGSIPPLATNPTVFRSGQSAQRGREFRDRCNAADRGV